MNMTSFAFHRQPTPQVTVITYINVPYTQREKGSRWWEREEEEIKGERGRERGRESEHIT